ncbi:hypothetical protein Tco_0347839 [Tanacetum coccineum]
MCYGSQRLPPSEDDLSDRPPTINTAVVETLRLRLAETEARIQRARAREQQLSQKLIQMKRFVSVMEIIESYLRTKFLHQQNQLNRLMNESTVKS